MLNTIKNMISAKKSYLEAAQIILENDDLDDAITLDQPAAEPEVKEPAEPTPAEEPAEEPKCDPADPGCEPAGDDLPEPVGKQTNEPVSDDSVNLLDVEINLATNTQDDVLPIPPANAQDSIPDDVMDQHVDAGFGEQEPEAPVTDTSDVMDAPIDQPAATGAELGDNSTDINPTPEEPVGENVMTEAINLGDEAPVEEPAEDGAAGEEPAPDAAQESPVTQAVKSKVAESEEPTEDPMQEPIEEPAEEPSGDVPDKKALLTKLSNLTKSLEDVKSMIVK